MFTSRPIPAIRRQPDSAKDIHPTGYHFPYSIIKSKPIRIHRPVGSIDRFNPHVKKPLKGEFFVASNLQPESTVLVEQVLETPSQSAGTQSVAQQQYGYYPNPSYVTLTPVTFTTGLPEVGDSVQPYTYYHIGAKFWYLSLIHISDPTRPY